MRSARPRLASRSRTTSSVPATATPPVSGASRLWASALIACVAVLAFPTPAFGQGDETGTAFAFAIDLLTPGARSAGMGRAFIAMADDATAAVVNPAGLTQLQRPEVSYQFRGASSETFIGGLGYPLSGEFEASSEVFSPSFLSFAVPFRNNTLATSVYFHRRVDSEADFEDAVLYPENTSELISFHQRLNRIKLDVLGASLAFAPIKYFSVGAGFQITRSHANVTWNWIGAGSGFIDSATVGGGESTDYAMAYNVGFRVVPLSWLSFGGMYQSGADYVVKRRFDSVSHAYYNDTSTRRSSYSERTLGMPSWYGFGVSSKLLANRLTLNFDVNRIAYSRLVTRPGDFDRPELALKDGTEFHFGGEYIFFVGSAGNPLAVRGGAYSDPGHHPYEGSRDTDQIRVAFGSGITLSDRFQVDGAFVWSRDVRELLLANVIQF